MALRKKTPATEEVESIQEVETPHETPAEEVVETPVTPPSTFAAESIIVPKAETEVQNVSIAASTAHQLQNSKMVERYYPLFDDEEHGCKACVTINGVPYWFEKGKQITLPEPVASVYDVTVERRMVGSPRGRAMLASRADFQNAFK